MRSVEFEIFKYARENLAIINIFIKESYTKRFRKTEKMSRISYIASSGGLLGLCMGFSFVSLAEILYHLCICLGLFCKRHKERFRRLGRKSGGGSGGSLSDRSGRHTRASSTHDHEELSLETAANGKGG